MKLENCSGCECMSQDEIRELRDFLIVSFDARTGELVLVKAGRKVKFSLLFPHCKLQRGEGFFSVTFGVENSNGEPVTVVCEGKQSTLNAVLASLDDNKPLQLLVFRSWVIEAKRCETG